MLMRNWSKKGIFNWLTILPIDEYGFELSEQQFLGFCLFKVWLENLKIANKVSM